MHQHRADEDEMTHAGLGGTTRQAQCAFDVDRAVQLGGIFLVRAMHAAAR